MSRICSDCFSVSAGPEKGGGTAPYVENAFACNSRSTPTIVSKLSLPRVKANW
jgi:hypothetical protein